MNDTMSNTPITSLSAGKAIYGLLSSDAALMGSLTKVFPVVADDAAMPYIAYRRVSLDDVPQKRGLGADSVNIEVSVFTEEYEAGISLAERVRSVLEVHGGCVVSGMILRSSYLTACEETWLDDAYVQRLVFTVRIGGAAEVTNNNQNE